VSKKSKPSNIETSQNNSSAPMTSSQPTALQTPAVQSNAPSLKQKKKKKSKEIEIEVDRELPRENPI
jgi:hypothetical protein